MDSYKVIMTSTATADLMELRNYIADALHSPDTARSYVQAIRREIDSLTTLPARYQLVGEEPWHSGGIRSLVAKNFFVYYGIDESEKAVYITNIVYVKRDQITALKNWTP